MTRSPALLPLLALLACSGEGVDAPVLPALPDRVSREELPPPEAERPVQELVITLTGEVRGEVKPCGCPTTPYGGFARRARLLERIRAQGLPTFVLDAGEMLVKGLRNEATPDRTARATTVLRLATELGLDAWAPARMDVEALGPAGVLASPGVCTRPEDLGLKLPAARVIERDGVRLGVLGLAGSDALRATPGAAVEALRAAMTNLTADAWVLLSNADENVNTAVAEQVKGLGAVLATRGPQHDAPRTTAGAPVIEAPDRGRYLTVLHVALGADHGPWSLVEGGAWDRYASERSMLGVAPPATREAVARRVATLRAEVAPLMPGRRLVQVEDLPLGSDLDGASTLDATLRAWANQSEADAERRAQTPSSRAGAYAGTGSCARCHADRLAAWTFHPHAKAYGTLLARGAGQDPECLGCHTTGWGQAGGYGEPTPAALRTWKGVQCEACHGPLGAHPDPQRGAPKVTEAACRRCHDEANSPQFDYASYLARTSCTMVSAQDATPPAESPLR